MPNETNEIRTTNEQGAEERLSFAETAPVAEFTAAGETERVWEFPAEPPAPRKRERSRQDRRWYRIFLSTVVVAALVTFSAVGILNTSGISVEKHFFSTTETAVFYEFVLNGYREGDDVVVEIHNEFVRYREPVSDSIASGEFYDLQPNMVYTVEVLCNGVSIFREKVRAAPQEYPMGP